MSEEVAVRPLTCSFPGCARPVPRTGGPGRPAEYCDLPEHTRWRAWRERQRIQDADNEQASVTVTKSGEDPRPASTAHGRAEELTDRVRLLANELTTSLAGAVRELGTMTDPATVAAELEATRTDAARRVAQAQADLAKADQRRRAAQRAAEQAEAAAHDAVAAAEQAEQHAEASRAGEQRAFAEAEAAIRRTEDDVASVRAEARDEVDAIRRDAADLVEQARIRAETRIEEAARTTARQIAAARAETEATVAAVTAERGRALDEAARIAAEQVSAARTEAEDMVASVAAERDAASHRVRVAELAAERAGQAAADARADLDLVRAELARGRQETATLRVAAERQLTERGERFQRELDQQRADAAEALRAARRDADAQLTALAEVRAQLLARAERAEARLDTVLAGRNTAGGG
ncbi:MAG TPA: hypothetical protein VH333_20685 [Pseudonocardiaceae bacterium]|nr:hypothetical protein [Pseudonocardiaceae bacterium]